MRRLVLAAEPELRARADRAGARELVGLEQAAVLVEDARDRMVLRALERRGDDDAADRQAAAACDRDRPRARRARRVRVVEHDASRARGERAIELAREVGERSAALVASGVFGSTACSKYVSIAARPSRCRLARAASARWRARPSVDRRMHPSPIMENEST